MWTRCGVLVFTMEHGARSHAVRRDDQRLATGGDEAKQVLATGEDEVKQQVLEFLEPVSGTANVSEVGSVSSGTRWASAASGCREHIARSGSSRVILAKHAGARGAARLPSSAAASSVPVGLHRADCGRRAGAATRYGVGSAANANARNGSGCGITAGSRTRPTSKVAARGVGNSGIAVRPSRGMPMEYGHEPATGTGTGGAATNDTGLWWQYFVPELPRLAGDDASQEEVRLFILQVDDAVQACAWSDERAAAHLVGRITGTITNLIRHKQAWRSWKAIRGVLEGAFALSTWGDLGLSVLSDLKQRPGQPTLQYLIEVEHVASAFFDAWGGAATCDTQRFMVERAIRGLLPSTFKDAIALQGVCSMQELRKSVGRALSEGLLPTRRAAQVATVWASHGTSGCSKGGRGVTTNGFCYKCGEAGHRRATCDRERSVCFRCKRPGHVAKRCGRSSSSSSGASGEQPQRYDSGKFARDSEPRNRRMGHRACTSTSKRYTNRRRGGQQQCTSDGKRRQLYEWRHPEQVRVPARRHGGS